MLIDKKEEKKSKKKARENEKSQEGTVRHLFSHYCNVS